MRRTVLAGTGVTVLFTAALTLQSAHAAPSPDPVRLTPAAAGKLATSLNSALGSHAAGFYYDAKDRKLVVNVTDEAGAERVRTAGAEARVVHHSLVSLTEARATLKAKAAVPGTAWAMDPKLNKIVVTADKSVDGIGMDRLNKVVAALGDRVVVERSATTFHPLISGGDAIWGPNARCSLGFNVTLGGEPYFLTAGHCTNEIKTWSDKQGGPVVAETQGGSFPGNDYGLAKFTTDIDHPSEVNLYNGSAQAITQAGDAMVGQEVQRSGSTTQLHSGTVTGLDATVNYPQGTVEGLIRTDVCAEPGDSGGSLFAGDTALGLTSGGSGNCTTGGTTYFQPVTEALEATGTEIG